MKVIWQEFKCLDKSTNHSTETEMIKEMIKQGHNLKYYCTYKSKREYYGLSNREIHYIDVPRIPKLRGFVYFMKMTLRNLEFIIKEKPDIIIMDNLMFLAALPSIIFVKTFDLRTRFILDIRTVSINHNRRKFKLIMTFFNLTLKLANIFVDGFSFISPFMKKYLHQICPAKLSSVIWTSGVNTELFDPEVYRRKRKDTAFGLFYHGGLSVSRGILDIMEATCLLRNKGLDIKLTLIGKLVEKKMILDFYKERNMEKFCEILAPVPIEKIPGHIKNCDLPIIPLSDFIGWRVSSPLKLMEYLAMEKPVVVTDIEAHRDVIGSLDCGFYIKSTSPKEIADGVLRAYRRRKDFKQMGVIGRKLITQNYTWKKQAELLGCYMLSLSNGLK